jgi:hypothetical protein
MEPEEKEEDFLNDDVALDDDLNDDGEYVAPPFNPHDLRCILTS